MPASAASLFRRNVYAVNSPRARSGLFCSSHRLPRLMRLHQVAVQLQRPLVGIICVIRLWPARCNTTRQ